MNKKTRSPEADDLLQTYYEQIRGFPLLSFEEELELSRRIQQGDQGARQKLIESNLRLVVKIARAYRTSNVSFMDIIQEGNLGLMHAAEKFDHVRNVRFSTYANWWIRQGILRFFANKQRAIRLPHRKEELLRKIRRAYHTLSQILLRPPNSGELAEEIGVPLEDIEFILSISSNMVSLETESGDTDFAAVVDLHEDYTYNPERALMRKSFHDDTMRTLNCLKDRERRILTYHFQLNGCERHTLKKIGDKMGISSETVRQIEMKALKKMRDNADDLRKNLYMEAI